MLTINELRNFGANVDEGLARMMNNEGFYLRMVGMGIDDKNFQRLEMAVEENDLNAAFEAAHALKGVLGNLSIDPMTKIVSEMTELLRSHTQMDYRPMLKELLAKREELIGIRNK